MTSQWCFTCCKECPLFGPRAMTDIEVAGLPCTDASMCGLRRFENGPTAQVFLAHCKIHLERRTPMMIIENVPDVHMGMLRKIYGQTYDLYPIYVQPADLGHNGTARSRVYVLLANREKVRNTYDCQELYQRISTRMKSVASTSPRDYFVAMKLHYLLNAREKEALKVFKQMYQNKYHQRAEDNKDLIFLGGGQPQTPSILVSCVESRSNFENERWQVMDSIQAPMDDASGEVGNTRNACLPISIIGDGRAAVADLRPASRIHDCGQLHAFLLHQCDPDDCTHMLCICPVRPSWKAHATFAICAGTSY
ncbi:Uncharacterized protein SCF082_LOCUS37876 [Durusdinium trenchii]|uniref:Uncharacterized protein n=1 Tax=Durusdinium trenchii TaxID=1381693 RepID=A0ABP0PUT8_9DINO